MKKLNKTLVILLLIFMTDGVNAESYVKCGLSTGIPSALPVFSTNLINLVKIMVPILLIILGMIDFAKAVISNDEKQMKDSQNKFIKRIMGALAVFLVVGVTQFIFKLIGENSTNAMASCIDCFVNNVCKTTDQYAICLSNGKAKCENNCYNATGSYSSSEFYACVNDCTYKKYCDETYKTGKLECEQLSMESCQERSDCELKNPTGSGTPTCGKK